MVTAGRTFAAALIAFAGPASAGQWNIVPRFGIGETWSDNVTLSDRNKQSDFITEIRPGISARGSGARLQLDLHYNLQALVYAKEGDRTSTNHQLQGDATLELLKHILFFEANSRLTQEVIDPQGRVGVSNVSVSGNRADALTYTFGPVVRHHFGRYADAEARFQRRRLETEANTGLRFGSSESDRVFLTLGAGRAFQRFRWRLSHDSNDTEFDSGSRSELAETVADMQWLLSRRYRLLGTVGYEDNQFTSAFRRRIDGVFWTVGAGWTPSRRTELTVQVGERFFGNTFSVRAEHRHRRWTLSANYNESPTTTDRFLSRQPLAPITDEEGRPVFDPEFDDRIPLDTTGRLTDDVFVNKQLSARVSYRRARDTFRVVGRLQTREFQSTGVEETVQGVAANWSRRLSKRLQSNLRVSWHEIDFQDTGRSTTRILVQPRLRYRLGPSIRATLEYLYHEQSGARDTDGFTENQISAFLDVHF